MTAVESIRQAFLDVGYRQEAVVRDHAFADVLSVQPITRKAPLAAFTRTPPSYRSAAFAVIEHEDGNAAELVRAHRSLGAPFMLLIKGNAVTVWQVRSEGPPRALETVDIAEVAGLFARNRQAWHPDAIHRAKSIGLPPEPYQIDFIDLGLLPAIEGELHVKLDRLLVESLNLVREAAGADGIDPRILFRVVFRLLAAKMLQDRGHPFASEWQANDLGSVLSTIERYYGLKSVDREIDHAIAQHFEPAWLNLQAGISFSNISADHLAFVYENTLVTDQARELFGTHSTPGQLAEYIVQRLELHKHQPNELKIYEPFSGAGVFLVSALRHLRDLLPDSWSDQKRHEFLIDHISGDEIDPFACEVATLSLILADYPNHNGWHINGVDLFEADALETRMASHNVILCNPPFEAFTAEEKARYPIASSKISKAIAVLSAAIDARPIALGFVLPRAFVLENQFAAQRRRLEALYGSVEIVELPDRIFGFSKVESAALVAKNPRHDHAIKIRIVSTEVADRDRVGFLANGRVTQSREKVRSVPLEPTGDLWIPPLADLWDFLKDAPVLDSVLRPRWGLRWKYKQDLAESVVPKEGYRPGFLKVRGFQQYVGKLPTYLDFCIENLREAYDQDWSRPKLIMNAMRLRRGPWRVGAVVDFNGLLYSQQFFGLWPIQDLTRDELYAFCGVLNGPVANAFLTVHSPRDRFRSAVVARIPIPTELPKALSSLVRDYIALAYDDALLNAREDRLAGLLAEIDALTLSAYDLPPERLYELNGFFADATRPVDHEWPPRLRDKAPAADGVLQGGALHAQEPSELGRVRKRVDEVSEFVHRRFLDEVPALRVADRASIEMGGAYALRQWRAEQRIFSVSDGDEDVFPTFQFDGGQPKPVIQAILKALPRGFSSWEIALWFVSSNPWLDLAAPRDVLSDPDRVIDAAFQASEEIIG